MEIIKIKTLLHTACYFSQFFNYAFIVLNALFISTHDQEKSHHLELTKGSE